MPHARKRTEKKCINSITHARVFEIQSSISMSDSVAATVVINSYHATTAPLKLRVTKRIREFGHFDGNSIQNKYSYFIWMLAATRSFECRYFDDLVCNNAFASSLVFRVIVTRNHFREMHFYWLLSWSSPCAAYFDHVGANNHITMLHAHSHHSRRLHNV